MNIFALIHPTCLLSDHTLGIGIESSIRTIGGTKINTYPEDTLVVGGWDHMSCIGANNTTVTTDSIGGFHCTRKSWWIQIQQQSSRLFGVGVVIAHGQTDGSKFNNTDDKVNGLYIGNSLGYDDDGSGYQSKDGSSSGKTLGTEDNSRHRLTKTLTDDFNTDTILYVAESNAGKRPIKQSNND